MASLPFLTQMKLKLRGTFTENRGDSSSLSSDFNLYDTKPMEILQSFSQETLVDLKKMLLKWKLHMNFSLTENLKTWNRYHQKTNSPCRCYTGKTFCFSWSRQSMWCAASDAHHVWECFTSKTSVLRWSLYTHRVKHEIRARRVPGEMDRQSSCPSSDRKLWKRERDGELCGNKALIWWRLAVLLQFPDNAHNEATPANLQSVEPLFNQKAAFLRHTHCIFLNSIKSAGLSPCEAE